MSAGRVFRVTALGRQREVRVLDFVAPTPEEPGRLRLSIDGREKALSLLPGEAGSLLLRDEKGAFHAQATSTPRGARVSAAGYSLLCEPAARAGQDSRSPGLTPPMPSVVARVLVAAGDKVEKNQGLVVLSAMKLETILRAPGPGRVKSVLVKAGDRVAPGDRLIELDMA